MIKLVKKKGFDDKTLETGGAVLGYEEIELVFNVGPFEGGGNCLIIKADGQYEYISSNDLIHDLQAYEIRSLLS